MPTLVPQATALKAKLFSGFSDRSRLSILEALRAGPMTVSAITEKTALSRTNVSNHLRCLSDWDLVVSHAQGRYTLYQLSDPRVATLLGLAATADPADPADSRGLVSWIDHRNKKRQK